MDPIHSLNPVLESLRRQLAQNIERLRIAGRLRDGPAGPAPAQGEALEAILRRRLSALDRRTPEGRARATRAFVESVLVAQFGEALLADPGVGELLGDVSASLREDPHWSAQLDALLVGLA